MTVTIREATGRDEDLATMVRIINETTPDDPDSIENVRWSNETYPGTSRFIAEDGGMAIGVGTVGRIYVHAPEFEAFWATITVVPSARRRGVGTALLATVSDRARERGKHVLHIPASEARPEGIDFLLHRGFSEYERSKSSSLELRDLTPPPPDVPDGIVLTTLADRPDLIAEVYAVGIEGFADTPGGDTPMSTGDLAEFRTREVDRPGIPHEGFFLAQDAASGRVVGYASLIRIPGAARSSAWHDMTAVARDYRGRGIAGALKRATIRWAIGDGMEVLEASNDTDNAAMRAINARAGYRPLPDTLTMRGPLFEGIMTP